MALVKSPLNLFTSACWVWSFYDCIFTLQECDLFRYWTQKEPKILCLHVPKRKLDLSSDLDLSTVWVQPICLAFLKMYCTVCHSSRCGLTSPTVKTTGGRPGLPAERQGWKLCRNGCTVSTPHPEGSLHELQAPGQATPQSSAYLGHPHTSDSYSMSIHTGLNCSSLLAAVV